MRTKAHIILALLLGSTAARADAPACGRLALALVIDRSGSMTGAKIDRAKAGAVASVDKLGTDDCVTVIAFDSAPSTVVALHPLIDPGAVKTAISNVQAAGGTDILVALGAAHQSLLGATRAHRRHVILLTDGQSPVAGLQALAQTMSGEHMTLSTVGLGSDVDETTLKMLATTASGRFYKVMDAAVLPTIMPREVTLALTP